MRIGKITENALKRSVLKPLKTEYKKNASAAVGTDCAFSSNRRVFSATSPMTADATDAGFYAVTKAINSIVCQGITPDHVTVSVLLDPDSEEQALKKIVADCLEACKEAGVPYAGGHTEVTTAVNRPVITATCVGYAEGASDEEKTFFEAKGKAGQAIVISKWAGLEGTAMLAKDRYDELITRYPAPFIDGAVRFKEMVNIGREAAVAMKAGALSIHDASNGGIFAALWELSGRAGCGLKVDLKAIPIRQETIEICEFFEINPYQLLSGGALLFTADDGERLADALREEGIPAAVVGFLQEGNDKIIVNNDETRFLDMPQTDEIHKVLG